MKYIRFGFAIVLLPLLAGFGGSFYELLTNLAHGVTVVAVPFWIGTVSYFVFQIIFFRPIKTYIFGHELTHTLAGILSGARLKSFKVSSSGGSVVLTKTNVWIALAPYFLPIYTIAVIGIYWLGNLFWQIDRYYPYFIFAAGFSLSFHFCLTYFALYQGQSDLKQFGIFFSIVIILIINCIMLAGLLKFIFPEQVFLGSFFGSAVEKTETIFAFLFKAAASAL